MDKSSDKKLYLLNYAENRIKVHGKNALIIIGTKDNKSNFMR